MGSGVHAALSELLKAEHEVLSRLRNLLTEEVSVDRHSPDDVLENVEGKKALVARLEQLAIQRQGMLPGQDIEASLSEIDDSGELARAFNDNLALARACHSANEANGLFIHQRQEMVSASIALLCGDHQPTYTRTGFTHYQGRRSLGSA